MYHSVHVSHDSMPKGACPQSTKGVNTWDARVLVPGKQGNWYP